MERIPGAASELSREQFRAVLDGITDGVTVQDPSGRLVYANEAAVHVLGYSSVEELLAAAPEEVFSRFEVLGEDGRPFPLERLPGRRALAGERPPSTIVRFRLRAGGDEHWSVVKATPLFGDDGRPALAINVFEDVSEYVERQEAQRFLAEAGKLLAGSLDFDATLAGIARLAVPRVADWCLVDVIDEEGGPRHVAVAHLDPEKVAVAEEIRRQPTLATAPDEGVARVLSTGRPLFVPEMPDELLEQLAEDEGQLRKLRALGAHSVMSVPMAARGRTLGALTFLNSESRRRFRESDLALAEELAARCGLAVDNARLFAERSHVARTLQRSLLPPGLPDVPGVEAAARFRAAGQGHDVGGDFYDLFQVGRDRWAAVMGDVCGKGPEAAALTALARYTVRAAALREGDPRRVLATLNQAILRQRGDRRFCTVAYALLEFEGGRVVLRVSSAGHPLPLVMRADGSVEEVGSPGTLLGVMRQVDLFEVVTGLMPGDALVLYTDGLADARAPEHIVDPGDFAGLLAGSTGASAAEISERLEKHALGDAAGEPRDDIAVLVLRVTAAGAGKNRGGAAGQLSSAS